MHSPMMPFIEQKNMNPKTWKGYPMPNLLPVKKIKPGENFPFTKSWAYKQVNLQKHPGLFVKIGGALFIDLTKFQELTEKGRLQ